MATLDWDHSMVNVQDLNKAIKSFADHGIRFELGGKHEAWGTSNALGYFGMNYIELISVDNLEKANQVYRSDAAAVYDAIQDFKRGVERPNTIAIRTDDLLSTWERLKNANVPVGKITEGQRLDERNHLIKWKIFFIDGFIDDVPYPFFIDWQSDDNERIKQLKQQGLIVSHPAGNLVLRQLLLVNKILEF